MFDWPPNWTLFFGVVAFLAASTAVRCWRELGILVLLSALLVFPIKWIGPALGFAALGRDAVTYDFSSAKDKFLHVTGSPALLAAIILGSLVMIAWKRRAARGQVEGE
jgi:hypothetical protein